MNYRELKYDSVLTLLYNARRMVILIHQHIHGPQSTYVNDAVPFPDKVMVKVDIYTDGKPSHKYYSLKLYDTDWTSILTILDRKEMEKAGLEYYFKDFDNKEEILRNKKIRDLEVQLESVGEDYHQLKEEYEEIQMKLLELNKEKQNG